MSKWQNQPFEISVKKGEKKAFCACNLSKTGPFCDGSHAKSNSGKTPFIVEFEKDEKVYVCGCQQSGSRPFCDGSHKTHKDV